MSNAQLQFRIKMEKAIAEKLVSDAVAAGYFVSIDNGEDMSKPSKDIKEILSNMFQTDEEHVFCATDERKSNFKVWFYFVYGNDGPDVINDYSANPESDAVIQGATKLADELENGNYSVLV